MTTPESKRSAELSDTEKALSDPAPLVPEDEETRKITGLKVSNRDG